MRLIARRLTEGEDLKKAIESLVLEYELTAVTILSAVGSLSHARIRMAGAKPDGQDIRDLDGPFEIVSLVGNLGLGRTHLHISISDSEGKVIGGHLKEGTIVHTTVELVIASEPKMTFTGEIDPSTGFEELRIDMEER